MTKTLRAGDKFVKDRSQEWTFDMHVNPNSKLGTKMAKAWDAILDTLGDKAFKLAADMDVTLIECQGSTDDPTWHIITVSCSKRALRAFEKA